MILRHIATNRLSDDPLYGVPALPPQLVLDHAPTTKELCLKRRELALARRLPRDGELVCTIPIDCEWEIRRLDTMVFWPRHFYSKQQLETANEREIGMMYGWRIMVRYSS